MPFQIAITQVHILYLTAQQKQFHSISVLRFAYGCQTKLEKLSEMLKSGAAKVREGYGTGPNTKSDVREMLHG